MIPVNEPLLDKQELQYVTECINTGWISSAGRFIEEFEEKWAAYCGVKYGIAVSSGTAALQVAAGCLDLRQGDEVIMPSFTIISCALAVIYNGAMPIFVDSDPRTWNIDTSKIEEKITNKTKAIMPVHIYGHPCNMDNIFELAKKYGLKIIEDAAQVHGAEYKGQKCGSLGDISCFSFYANKIITTGEGGMIVTQNNEYAEKARSLRNLCFQKDKRFFHTDLGYNFRLTNLQASIGLAQLERIDKLVEKKRQIGQNYTQRLKNIPSLQLPVEESWAKNVYWMYGVVMDSSLGITAEDFAKRLLNLGIQTRPFFYPLHCQPAFKTFSWFKPQSLPVAENLYKYGLYLPSGLTLTEENIQEVVDAVKQAMHN